MCTKIVFFLHFNNIGPQDKEYAITTEKTTTATTSIEPLLELPKPSEINHLTEILKGFKHKGKFKE